MDGCSGFWRGWPEIAMLPRICSKRPGCASCSTPTASIRIRDSRRGFSRSARNLYISYCRSRSLEESSAGIGLWPVAPSPPSPFEAAAGSELGRRLEAALASLPAVSREVLLLVGGEGMTPSEAAGVCGVTPETMRQRLSRARALLAARLDEARARQVSILKEVAS